jgi:type II secretory pathway component GspD/PulD (secretin)
VQWALCGARATILALGLASPPAAVAYDADAGQPQPSRALPPLPATRLDEGGHAALDDVRGLSLTFSKPLPIRDVLLLLVRGTPFSLVMDPAASGAFAGELRDVTLRQALASVLAPAGLDYQVDGSIVRVFRKTPQTRFFPLDHLHLARSGVDAFAEIADGVHALLSPDGRQHVDRKAALVQVTDFAERLDSVAAYIETVRLRMSRQVRIQARIIEVGRPDATPADWVALAQSANSGASRAPTSGALRIDDVQAWLAAMERAGPLRLVSSPTLLVMSSESATLRAGDTAEGSEVRLALTPQIGSDGFVMLHAAPQYIAGSFTAAMDTVVRLADGESAFLAGLMRRGPASPVEVVVLLTVDVAIPTAREAAGAFTSIR